VAALKFVLWLKSYLIPFLKLVSHSLMSSRKQRRQQFSCIIGILIYGISGSLGHSCLRPRDSRGVTVAGSALAVRKLLEGHLDHPLQQSPDYKYLIHPVTANRGRSTAVFGDPSVRATATHRLSASPLRRVQCRRDSYRSQKRSLVPSFAPLPVCFRVRLGLAQQVAEPLPRNFTSHSTLSRIKPAILLLC
jgi:hypothetical protein